MGAHRATPTCPPRGEERLEHAVDPSPADHELAALARALGHPARVRIVRLLTESDNCRCGDIVDELPLAQPTVSEHLRVLREAGILRSEAGGTCVCYHLEPLKMRRLRALLQDLWPQD